MKKEKMKVIKGLARTNNAIYKFRYEIPESWLPKKNAETIANNTTSDSNSDHVKAG